jgi:hypothetical protein
MPFTLGRPSRSHAEGLTQVLASSDVRLTAREQSLFSHHSRFGAQQQTTSMIQLTRNNKVLTAVVTLLVSVSAAGMSLTTARAAPEHPPVMALAVLPSLTRPERERRYAVARSLRLRLVRRLRKSQGWSRRRGLNLLPRLSVREWHARGPPR